MWGDAGAVRHGFCFGIDSPYVSDKYPALFRRLFFLRILHCLRKIFPPPFWPGPIDFLPESPHVLSSVLISRVLLSSSAFPVMARSALAGLRCREKVSERLRKCRYMTVSEMKSRLKDLIYPSG